MRFWPEERRVPSGGRLAVLGGTFNPVHAGHLRIALELTELLRADAFCLLPSAAPPHKADAGILSFELRCDLLEAALRGLPPLVMSRLEGERDGPSYTWDTLAVLEAQYPGAERFFCLGSEDFAKLPQWRHGLLLPARAHLCVVPRGEDGEAAFLNTAQRFWPGCTRAEPAADGAVTLRVPVKSGAATTWGLASYLNVPFLAISATRLRQHWLAGRDIRLLAPDAVLERMETQRAEIEAVWRNCLENRPETD